MSTSIYTPIAQPEVRNAHGSRTGPPNWVQQQIAYYRARAGEYDEAYVDRMGMKELTAVLDTLPIRGDVLDLACGTGQWTKLLAPRAHHLTALDAAPEMLALARQRLQGSGTRFVQTDVFNWVPQCRYDTVFFAFWLSHVPLDRLPGFWRTLRLALKPDGNVVFFDDSLAKGELEEAFPDIGVPAVHRRLSDGSQHLAVKVLHEPDMLATRLRDLDWWAEVSQVDPYHTRAWLALRGTVDARAAPKRLRVSEPLQRPGGRSPPSAYRDNSRSFPC